MSDRAGRPRLIALTDQETYPDCVVQAEQLCEQAEPGSVAIILRDREISARKRLLTAERLRRTTSEHKQHLYVSDRVDLARIVSADGVHLPASGFRPNACREIWGGLISRAGHAIETLEIEDWASLDLILISPVAETRKGKPALGEEGFIQARDYIRQKNERVSAYALGGVTAKSAATYIRAGADGVAAVGAAWGSKGFGTLLAALGIRKLS